MVAVPSLFVLLMAKPLAPAPEIAGFEGETKSYLFLVGIALLLGFCVVALVGPFILGPIYDYRAELNGVPFQAGDRVGILVGANRGHVARVVEVWDGAAICPSNGAPQWLARAGRFSNLLRSSRWVTPNHPLQQTRCKRRAAERKRSAAGPTHR
jgi:hypothetical protein